MHHSVTEPKTFYHSSCPLYMHEHKILVSLSAQCSLHNSAWVYQWGDSQSSRRRARGNSIASKASAPNDAEVCLAKQTPFLHWQILTFTVCISPKPCRSLMSTGTLCIPVGSALICSNVAAVSGEETHVNKSMKRRTFIWETAAQHCAEHFKLEVSVHCDAFHKYQGSHFVSKYIWYQSQKFSFSRK